MRRRLLMIHIFQKQHGMSIVGQGGKIILLMLPSLLAAVGIHVYFPRIAALPGIFHFIRPLGSIVLVMGLILWTSGVIQLLIGFSRGKLVTTGVYRIARNPIYASATFFILPAVALLTQTWVYFVVSFFLYAGVMMFIGTEEKQLTEAFGREYEDYLKRVDRLVPFKRP
jgi:protein-S-isoprenylcysteine O-methyltransferase Ste14